MSQNPGKFQLPLAQNRGARQKMLERTQSWIKLGGKVKQHDQKANNTDLPLEYESFYQSVPE